MQNSITISGYELKLSSLILVCLTFLTLISLGSWQLHRRSEKLKFIDKIENNVKNPAVLLTEDNKALYSKIMINGNFLENSSVFVYGRRTSNPEKDGYYMLSVLNADNGKKYLVSRGWIPQSAKDKISHFKEKNQKHQIEAIILQGENRKFMVPENDCKNKIWFTIDLDMAKKILGITENNFYLMQINSQYLPQGGKPLHTNNLNKIRNDHMEYAITWYGLAICLLIMYFINIRRK
ncbi:MAG: hypothetical protein DGJ47_000379 [Rickettsiaceae bacterium]